MRSLFYSNVNPMFSLGKIKVNLCLEDKMKLKYFNYVHYRIFHVYTKLVVKITLNYLHISALTMKTVYECIKTSLFNSIQNREAATTGYTEMTQCSNYQHAPPQDHSKLLPTGKCQICHTISFPTPTNFDSKLSDCSSPERRRK